MGRGSSGRRGRVRTRANAVMLLPFFDDRVITAFQVWLLLHEFKNPSLVRQRRRLRLVCHLWPALCVRVGRGYEHRDAKALHRDDRWGCRRHVLIERESYSAGAGETQWG